MTTLDSETLTALLELDRDTGGTLILEMIAGYRSEYAKRLAAIEINLETHRGAELAFEAHAMKSTFANFGAVEITACFQDLETAGRAHNWASGRDSLAKIKTLLSDFESDIQQLEANVRIRKSSQAS